jgi:hypothetical protein
LGQIFLRGGQKSWGWCDVVFAGVLWFFGVQTTVNRGDAVVKCVAKMDGERSLLSI